MGDMVIFCVKAKRRPRFAFATTEPRPVIMFDADSFGPRQAHGPEVERHSRLGRDLAGSRRPEEVS